MREEVCRQDAALMRAWAWRAPAPPDWDEVQGHRRASQEPGAGAHGEQVQGGSAQQGDDRGQPWDVAAPCLVAPAAAGGDTVGWDEEGAWVRQCKGVVSTELCSCPGGAWEEDSGGRVTSGVSSVPGLAVALILQGSQVDRVGAGVP